MTVLRLVRYGLPALMVVLGVWLIVTGGYQSEAAGITIIGSASLVFLAGALVRSSVKENEVRDQEQAARDFYGQHGRWPEDPDPAHADADAPLPEPPAETAPPPGAHPGYRETPSPERTGRRQRRARPPRRPGD